MNHRDLSSGKNSDGATQSAKTGFSLPSWPSSPGSQWTIKSMKQEITIKCNRTHSNWLACCLSHSQMPFEIFPQLSQQMLPLFITIVNNMWHSSLDKMSSSFYTWCCSHCSPTSPSLCDSFQAGNVCIFIVLSSSVLFLIYQSVQSRCCKLHCSVIQ